MATKKRKTGKRPKRTDTFTTHLMKVIGQKVDPERFLYLLGVYQAAAERKFPTPPGRFVPPENPRPGTLMFTDRAENRGAFAVMDELRDLGVTDDIVRQAYLWRIMDVGQVFDERDQIAEFIKPAEDGLLVDECLLKAIALADYDPVTDLTSRARISLTSVLMHARRLKTQEEGDDS